MAVGLGVVLIAVGLIVVLDVLRDLSDDGPPGRHRRSEPLGRTSRTR